MRERSFSLIIVNSFNEAIFLALESFRVDPSNPGGGREMIPYSRPKLSDLYTLSQSKLLENHTLHSGTYLYSPYMAVPSLAPGPSNRFIHPMP